MNATAVFSFHLGRSGFFRGFGIALPIASRTIRRCTLSFLDTPAIVPTPNSYSRRICSNNSTFALQSNEFPPLRASPESEYPFVRRVGQNKPPNWASSEYRNHAMLRGEPDMATMATQVSLYDNAFWCRVSPILNWSNAPVGKIPNRDRDHPHVVLRRLANSGAGSA
jgi:hypothetical protein